MNKIVSISGAVLFFAWAGADHALHAGEPGAAPLAEFYKLRVETKGKLDDRHFALLRKSAEAGNTEAQANLGVYLVTERGKDDPSAFKEGMSWLKKIEYLDKPEYDGAAFLLALCYWNNGAGTKTDFEHTGALLERVAPRGNTDMKIVYAYYLLMAKNDANAAKTVLTEVLKDDKHPQAQQEARDLLKKISDGGPL